MSQLSLDPSAKRPPSAHRVRSLAGILAGFRWPGRGGFEKLKKAEQEASLRIARRALEELEREPD